MLALVSKTIKCILNHGCFVYILVTLGFFVASRLVNETVLVDPVKPS